MSSLNKLIKLLNDHIEQGKKNISRLDGTDYFKRGASAYLIVEGPSWVQAKQNANKLGGNLVIVNDYNENKWLVDNLSYQLKYYDINSSGQYWIGNKYENNPFSWSSREKVVFKNWKIGNPDLADESSLRKMYTKVTLLRSSNELRNKLSSARELLDEGSLPKFKFERQEKEILDKIDDLNKYSGKWEIAINDSKNLLFGIAEVNIAQSFADIDPDFEDVYFRRGLAKSELGEKRGAINDFTKDIAINPTNGQAYFQRGLENFWRNRNSACEDISKGLSLGAKDTSSNLLLNRKVNQNLLREFAKNDQFIIKSCQGKNNTKAAYNQSNYQFELLLNELKRLIGKYFIILPIIAIFLWFIFIKYNDRDN